MYVIFIADKPAEEDKELRQVTVEDTLLIIFVKAEVLPILLSHSNNGPLKEIFLK